MCHSPGYSRRSHSGSTAYLGPAVSDWAAAGRSFLRRMIDLSTMVRELHHQAEQKVQVGPAMASFPPGMGAE